MTMTSGPRGLPPLAPGATGSLIAFRCDGTSKTGLGHVSRCLALAEALQGLGAGSLFLGEYEPQASGMIEACGFPKISCTKNGAEAFGHGLEEALEAGANAMVLDSYDATVSWLEAINGTLPLAVIDDFCQLEHYPCALVLNFTIGAARHKYPHIGARALLGTKYFLARAALVALRQQGTTPREEVRRVLVSLGGTGHSTFLERILLALSQCAPDVDIRVVAPNLNASIQAVITQTGATNITWQHTLAEHFAWADVCISGGGLTKYESAYLGVPAAAFSISREQEMETQIFAQAGLTHSLGFGENPQDVRSRLDAFLKDAAERARLRANGLAQFPADAPHRAAAELCEVLLK